MTASNSKHRAPAWWAQNAKASLSSAFGLLVANVVHSAKPLGGLGCKQGAGLLEDPHNGFSERQSIAPAIALWLADTPC